MEVFYKYGMKSRGFSIGCQPMNGFVNREDDEDGRYYDIICYNRKLTVDEIKNYELDFLGYMIIDEDGKISFN